MKLCLLQAKLIDKKVLVDKLQQLSQLLDKAKEET